MKTLLVLMMLAWAALSVPPPKPPIGVPTDAKYFNGRWYKVVMEKGIEWHRAKAKCQQMGGQLLTVEDSATWEFVKSIAKGPILWIGMTDEEVTGVWKWIDGTPVTFTAWDTAQPDNTLGIQHYAAMNKNGKMDDLQKEVKSGPFEIQGFICQWPARK